MESGSQEVITFKKIVEEVKKRLKKSAEIASKKAKKEQEARKKLKKA